MHQPTQKHIDTLHAWSRARAVRQLGITLSVDEARALRVALQVAMDHGTQVVEDNYGHHFGELEQRIGHAIRNAIATNTCSQPCCRQVPVTCDGCGCSIAAPVRFSRDRRTGRNYCEPCSYNRPAVVR